MEIIVVGLGHEMHGDGEVGLEVVRSWGKKKERTFPGVQTALLESPGLNLLGQIAGRDAAILVAAVQAGAPLGSVQVVQDLEPVSLIQLGRIGGSRGAAETLSLGRQLVPEELPQTLILIGIEGAAFGLGEGLSPAVRGAIPQALWALESICKELYRKDQPLRWTVTLIAARLQQLVSRLGRK